jgi:alkylated DNA nucleotide flippase Atl1
LDPSLIRIVEFLNRERVRATYEAVADVAGVPARSVGRLLGDRCELASWVVNGKTGEPTGYTALDKHPALYERSEIITSGDDLIRRMRRAT